MSATSSATVVGNGRWVELDIRNSAPTTSSTAELIEALADVVMMLKPVTNAKPTMTADAVAADLRGWRAALSIASRPTVPKTAGRGAPIVRETGLAKMGAKMIAPISAPSVPSPTRPNPPASPEVDPEYNAHALSARSTPPMIPRLRNDDVGITASSRSAATGGMRDARRAGNQAEATVISTPSTSPMMNVPGSSTSAVSPMSTPMAPKPERSSIVTMMPNPHPTMDANRPTIADSISTEPMI